MLSAMFNTGSSKVKHLYWSLDAGQRLYVNAAVTLLAYFISCWIFSPPAALGFLYISFLYWMAAIIKDSISFYVKISGHALVKASMVLLFSLCAALSVALSSQVVNHVVGISPREFPSSIAMLSIMTIPFFIALGFSVLSVVVGVTAPLYLVFHLACDAKLKRFILPGYSPVEMSARDKFTIVIKAVGLIFFFGLGVGLAREGMGEYENFLASTAGSLIFQLEMYPKTVCEIPPDGRVAFLGSGQILLGESSPKGVLFSLQECRSAAGDLSP